MSVPQNSFSVCLFCYKTIDYSVRNDDNDSSVTINKFIKLLNRIGKTPPQKDSILIGKVLVEKDGDNDNPKNLFNCCTKCEEIVVDCCEIFHQLKILEMRLDGKLDKLARTINHANNVPARWINFNKAFGYHCQDDLGKNMSINRAIRDLRHSVVNKANQRRRDSQPRVLLNRLKDPAPQSPEPEPSTSGSPTTSSVSKETTETTAVKTKPIERCIPSKANSSKLNNNILVCQKCGKGLKSLKWLRHHLELHEGGRNFKWGCDQCGKRFSCESKLNRHLRCHIDPKLYACHFCGVAFSLNTSLKEHLEKYHENERNLQIELNNWQVGSPEKIGNGNTLESPTSFQDPLIETKVEHLTIVQDGANNSNSQPSQPKQRREFFNDSLKISVENKTCLRCNKTFSKRSKLIRHISETSCSGIVRLEKLPCKICGTELRTEATLKRHMEFHKSPDEWSCKCVKCGKMFVTRDCLTQHLKRRHEQITKVNEKTVKCRYCEKRYSEKRYLNRHMDSLHWKEKRDSKVVQEEQIKKFEKNKVECKICGRKFASVLKNVRHFRMVHGSSKLNGKTFKCTMDGCKAYFLRRAQLQIHLQSEHGDMIKARENGKRFKCRFCEKGYNCENKLLKHLNTFHKTSLKEDVEENEKKKFKCEYCESRFVSRRCVHRHIYDEHWKENKGVKETEESLKTKFKFECEVCSKRFSLLEGKRRHFEGCHNLKGKSLKETFKCGREGCGAYFLTRVQVTTHWRMDHGIITGRRMKMKKHIKCRYCMKKFVSKIGLGCHLHQMHWKEMRREKDRLIRGNSDAEDDYEMRAIEEIIRQERGNYLGQVNEQSNLEDEGFTKSVRSEGEFFEEYSNINGEMETGKRMGEVSCCSVEVKREENYEGILNELEIREDEEDNCENSEMRSLNETRYEDDDLNTFGRNLEIWDDGTLAELEDLD